MGVLHAGRQVRHARFAKRIPTFPLSFTAVNVNVLQHKYGMLHFTVGISTPFGLEITK